MRSFPLLVTALLGLGAAVVQAQPQAQHIYTPMASPRAETAQRIGLTDIRVTYHRPAVNDRDVWGQVVPSAGTPVWRTGANENTVISFSTDVLVQGQPLAAGSYGLHTIPGEGTWTIVFSNDTNAWGSFAYDQDHDALRVEAKTEKAAHQEHFAIAFDGLASDGVDVTLRWAEVAVPVRVTVDLEATVLASFRDQLTGLSQFFWPGWNQAAQFCLTNDLALEEALGWSERSIQAEERFNNLQTKAGLLTKLDRAEEAESVLARALDIANAGQLHGYGRQLLAQGKLDDAKAVFDKNLAKHPDAWFVTVGPARYHSAKGEFDTAAKNMRTAFERAPENLRPQIEALLKQLESGQSI